MVAASSANTSECGAILAGLVDEGGEEGYAQRGANRMAREWLRCVGPIDGEVSFGKRYLYKYSRAGLQRDLTISIAWVLPFPKDETRNSHRN